MEKAINSILIGGEDVEILIVNDGSKRRNAEIAERYEAQYRRSRRSKRTEDTAMQSTADFLMPQENILK